MEFAGCGFVAGDIHIIGPDEQRQFERITEKVLMAFQ